MLLGFDLLIVGAVAGDVSLGYYGAAFTVTNLPLMALSGVGAIALHRIAAANPASRAQIARRWLAGAVAVDLVIVAGLELVIDPAIRIVLGREFVPAIDCARIMIVAWAFLALRIVIAYLLQGMGLPGRVSVAEVIGGVALVPLVFVGVQSHGIVGAALGMCAAGFLACLVLVVLLVDALRGHVTAAPDTNAQPRPSDTLRP
jgi:O-antigen/teichoic acid export membrane protein